MHAGTARGTAVEGSRGLRGEFGRRILPRRFDPLDFIGHARVGSAYPRPLPGRRLLGRRLPGCGARAEPSGEPAGGVRLVQGVWDAGAKRDPPTAGGEDGGAGGVLAGRGAEGAGGG